MTATLRQTVDDFLQKEYRRNKKGMKTASNLLNGGISRSGEKTNPYVFIKQDSLCDLVDEPINAKVLLSIIPMAIRDSVVAYTKENDTAIAIYQKLLAYLQKEHGLHVDIEFPPTFNSQFDRQMYIVKSLHHRKYSARELADELWISERTIEKDLEELDKGMTVLGQELRIFRDEIGPRAMELNTIHPIFLVANLTQIVVLLRGLEDQAKDRAYREYAERLAANIWGELSDYGKNRIREVSASLNLNTTWFEILEEKNQSDLYSSEARCSDEEGASNVLYFLKNRKPCTIEIWDGNKTKILENCRIKGFAGENSLSISCRDQEIEVPMDSIIRANNFAKCIY